MTCQSICSSLKRIYYKNYKNILFFLKIGFSWFFACCKFDFLFLVLPGFACFCKNWFYVLQTGFTCSKTGPFSIFLLTSILYHFFISSIPISSSIGLHIFLRFKCVFKLAFYELFHIHNDYIYIEPL